MNELRIIFMGTPDFAVPSLDILVENGFNIVAVITAPDKPKGRGQKLASSPVKESAVNHNIPVLQPVNLKDSVFLDELRDYEANLQIVVAFRMLPEVVWNMPKIGTFNLHASLLPQYRGAAPIHWAIINGEKETGVTTFFLKHEIDTGKIIFREKEPIHPDDTVGSLYQRLMQKGGRLVLKTVQAIAKNDYPQVDQVESNTLSKAPKIFRETCKINWHQPATKVYDFIRGLSPYPGAWTEVNGKVTKLFRVKLAENDQLPDLQPGDFLTDNKKTLYFKTSDYLLEVMELQLAGKKRMTTEELLRGSTL